MTETGRFSWQISALIPDESLAFKLPLKRSELRIESGRNTWLIPALIPDRIRPVYRTFGDQYMWLNQAVFPDRFRP